jgi:hypothetical protein
MLFIRWPECKISTDAARSADEKISIVEFPASRDAMNTNDERAYTI